MQDDIFGSIFLLAFIGLITWLIAAQLNLKLRITDRILCIFGKHSHTAKEDGKPVSKYRCQICDKAKKHPHLRVINGGKKTVDWKFPF